MRWGWRPETEKAGETGWRRAEEVKEKLSPGWGRGVTVRDREKEGDKQNLVGNSINRVMGGKRDAKIEGKTGMVTELGATEARIPGRFLPWVLKAGLGPVGGRDQGRFDCCLRDRATRNKQPGEMQRTRVWGWWGSQAHPRGGCRGASEER